MLSCDERHYGQLTMVDEPTVLDYFKSIFTFSRGRILKIPGGELEKGTENISGEVLEASQEILNLDARASLEDRKSVV